MIRHMVFFKLTEEAVKDREAVILKMRAPIENMVGKIPGLIKAELGENVSGGVHDIAIYCELEKKEDIAIYQDHPLHVAYKELIKNWVENRACVDFEIL